MIPIAKPQIGQLEISAVSEVLMSGKLAQGDQVALFEDEFASAFDIKHAVAVSSGTAALHLALLAAGIGKGDEVITSPFSFIASANAIRYTGATPVFADVDPDTFNLDPSRVEEAITRRTRAILPVSLFGLPARMDLFSTMAARRDLFLLEDACQAHGASIDGKFSGSWGTAAFSFYPTKNMTTGEGGMVTTSEHRIADQVRLLRNHGMRMRYVHESLGYNLRMTEMAAAIGRVQLRRLEGFNNRRRQLALAYNDGIEFGTSVRMRQLHDPGHVFHQYTLQVERRDTIIEALEDAGVGYGIYYPIPIHRQAPYVADYGHLDLPVADRLAREVLSLPIYPSLTDSQQLYVIKTLNEAAR